MPTDVFSCLVIQQFSPTHPAGGEIHEIVNAHIYLNFYSVKQQSHSISPEPPPTPATMSVRVGNKKRGERAQVASSGTASRSVVLSRCSFCNEYAGENSCSESGRINSSPKKAQMIRCTNSHADSSLYCSTTDQLLRIRFVKVKANLALVRMRVVEFA